MSTEQRDADATSSEAGAPEELRELAEAHGVATGYTDFSGRWCHVPETTIRAVLGALDVPAHSSEEVAGSLEELRDAEWRRVLPSCLVLPAGQPREMAVHVPDGAQVAVTLHTEDGQQRQLEQLDVWVEPRIVDGRRMGRATFEVPGNLPLGWHELVAEVRDHEAEGADREAGGDEPARCPLVLTPRRLEPDVMAPSRAWGVMAQLYSVRSQQSWGMGDFADLTELVSLFSNHGADFILINPLHAAESVPPITPSPYLPVSRRFTNPLYIRPEDIRECAYLPGPQRSLVAWAAEEVRGAVNDPGPIDRDAVWQAKRQALEVLFVAGRSPARQRELESFRREHGQGLEDFALWCALQEHFDGESWSEEFNDIDSPAVLRARRALSERIDFYSWLQWIADEQLAGAQHMARANGMALGVMPDLAVGVHPRGADVWLQPKVFAHGMTVGAPPDMYNQQGQDWSQPPWHPTELARAGYRPLREVLRSVLRHAGAVRIDHIMSLFRLWWVPHGRPADEGTYVAYDHEAMVGILLLEAQRAGVLVIGEDLGTVEPWVRDYLADRGVLGTSVVWFEKDTQNRPLAPEEYRSEVLATVTTHDLPPTASYLAAEHVDLRERLELLTRPAPVVRAEARRERDKMLDRLDKRGLLPDEPTERQVVEALHAYVLSTPARLVGVALTDAVGERRAQNQPGTDEEYPNWQLPLTDGSESVVSLEDLADSARLRSLLALVRHHAQPAPGLAPGLPPEAGTEQP